MMRKPKTGRLYRGKFLRKMRPILDQRDVKYCPSAKVVADLRLGALQQLKKCECNPYRGTKIML
jgi:hypothetical protein